MEMFNNGLKIPEGFDISKPFQEIRENQTGILTALAKMGQTLEDFYKSYKKHEDAEMGEDIFVSYTENKTFRSGGYRYNRLYVGKAAVSDAAKLTITLGGIAWDVTLAAGENVVNIPDGATYIGATTSGNGFMAHIVRSNRQ